MKSHKLREVQSVGVCVCVLLFTMGTKSVYTVSCGEPPAPPPILGQKASSHKVKH